MNSSEQIIRELENRRKTLNERLMNSRTIEEANTIERELWALRTALRHHKSVGKRQSTEATPKPSSSSEAAGLL